MAKYQNKRLAFERGSVVEPQGNATAEIEAGELAEQRKDSESGNREGGKEEKGGEGGAVTPFPLELHYPDAPIVVYEHFAKSMDDFQYRLSHSKDATIKHLTITQATLDAPVMPEIHHSPYCGFRVVKGDVFSVRLSNGRIIEAVPA